jgi:hypothetical protein
MKGLNFILKECTSLRYFVPVIDEAKSRGIRSNFFIGKSRKYNCPSIGKNKKEIVNIVDFYEMGSFSLGSDKITASQGDVTITTEGVGIEHINKDLFNVSMSSMTDFTVSYKNYVDHVDHVLLPSEFMAKHYHDMKVYPIDNTPAGGTNTEKNIYFGSTKYDIDLNNFSYGLRHMPKNKLKLLLFAPNRNDAASYRIFDKLLALLSKNDNFTITVKSRGKHPVPKNLRGDAYFEDTHWYPHTSMVLINESDFVITFGSTVTKECVMLSKPFANIDMKKFKHLDFLKSSSCIRIEEENIDYKSFIENIFEVVKRDNTKEFYDLRSEYLFNEPIGNVSKKLLDFCIENVG